MSRTSSRGAHRSGRNYRHRHLKKFKLTFTYKVRTSRHPYKRFDDMKSVYDIMIDKKDFYSETKIGYFFTKCFTDVDGKDLSTELADPGAHFLAFHDSATTNTIGKHSSLSGSNATTITSGRKVKTAILPTTDTRGRATLDT